MIQIVQINNPISRISIAFSLAGMMAIAPGLSNAARAEIQFNNPDDPIPADTVGGMTNEASFLPPEDVGAPDETVGGGIRGDVEFQLPEDGDAPDGSVGGGVRGDEVLSSGVEAGIRGDGEHLPVLDLTSPETTEVWEEVQFLTPSSLAPENTSVDVTGESSE